MASGFANASANSVLNQILRSASALAPATIAIALATSAPTDASTGASFNEVANSGSYARVSVNPGTGNWNAGSSGVATNINVINFPAATGSWGTVTHIVVLDNATYGAGNILWWGLATASFAVSSGMTYQIAAAALSLGLA